MDFPTSNPLKPVPFSIQNRQIPAAGSPEEEEELLAEYDFLLHHSRRISASLGGKRVVRMILKEEQALLAFHLLNQEDIRGYQSSRPYPWIDAFSLF